MSDIQKKIDVTPEAVQGVSTFLMYRKKQLLGRLKPLIQQREELLSIEDNAFKEDIEDQFRVAVRREIADEIANSLNLNPEEVYLIVESMDVDGFLNYVKGN